MMLDAWHMHRDQALFLLLYRSFPALMVLAYRRWAFTAASDAPQAMHLSDRLVLKVLFAPFLGVWPVDSLDTVTLLVVGQYPWIYPHHGKRMEREFPG